MLQQRRISSGLALIRHQQQEADTRYRHARFAVIEALVAGDEDGSVKALEQMKTSLTETLEHRQRADAIREALRTE